MTPEQALAVLNATFSELKALQPQQQLSSSQFPFLLASGEALTQQQRQQQQEEEEDKLSVSIIAQAISTLGNDINDGRALLQETFDAVFRFLHEQLTLSAERGDMGLTPPLDIVTRIIHAAHLACAVTPGNTIRPQKDMNSELRMVFSSIANQLLEPVWVFLCDTRQQESEVGCEVGERNIRVLLQFEIVLASLLQKLLGISQYQSCDAYLSGLVDLCHQMALIFEDPILPVHLMPQCNADVAYLLSGLLALLQILWNLDHIPSAVEAVQDQILTRLLTSDIIERTLQSLQSASLESAGPVITSKRFIGALMVMIGMFCESPAPEDTEWTARPGDVLPDLDVLATFEMRELWMYLVARGNQVSEQGERDRLAIQRWAIGLYYLRLRYNRMDTCDYRPLWDSIPILFANEQCLDHLYGTSWIQLVYIYVTLDQAIDPTGAQRRPFSLSKIISGLQQSVHGGDNGSMAYDALVLHVEEILLWLWSHDSTSTQDSIAKELPDVLLAMMFILLEKEFRLGTTMRVQERRLLEDGDGDGVGKVGRIARLVLQYPLALCSLKAIFSDTCRLLEVNPSNTDTAPRCRILYIVCSIIKAFARRCLAAVEHEDDGHAKFKLRVCEDIVDAGIRFCANGHVSETELIYVWEMLDAVVPLFKPRQGKQPLVEWHGYQDLSRVIGKLLLQVEQCQAGTVWQGQQQLVLFFTNMWSNIRLMALHVDVDDVVDVSYFQSELLSSLWETIQELMHLLLVPSIFSQLVSTFPSNPQQNIVQNQHNDHQHRGPDTWQEVWSCVADCAVEGMLLLHNTHARFPELITFTVDKDQALMVHYSLKLMDVFVRGAWAYRLPLSDPRDLVFELVRWVMMALSNGGGGSSGGEYIDASDEGPKSRESSEEELWSRLDLLLDCLSDYTFRETNDSMVWKTLRVYVTALLSCFHQGSPSFLHKTASAPGKAPNLALFIYPTPQADVTLAWIQRRLGYQGHKEFLTELWCRWNAAARIIVVWMQRALWNNRGVVGAKRVETLFHSSRTHQEQDSAMAHSALNAQGLAQLGRVVSDILTLMRMILHEGPRDEYHCRPLDLEFVDWTMRLIDSKLVTEAAQTMRDLTAAGAAEPDPGDNCFVSSLAELAKIREECANIQARYCYCC